MQKAVQFLELCFKHRFKVVLGIIATALFLCSFIPRMKADYSVQYWFDENSELISDIRDFEKIFGSEKNIIIVLDAPESSQDLFTKVHLKTINEISEKLLEVPDINSVRSITHFSSVYADGDEIITAPIVDAYELDNEPLEIVKQRALEDRILKNYIVSNDLKTTLIFGLLRPTFDSPDSKAVDNNVLIENVNKLLQGTELNGLKVQITGSSKYQQEFRRISEKDLFVITPLMLFLVMLFIYLSFRTVESVVICMTIIGVCIGSAFGIGALVGVRFENLVSAVPGILFAICIADSVHILVTYYRYRNYGQNVRQALVESIKKNFIPTLLTSVTTSIGFFSLVVSDLNPIRNLGILAGTGALLAWLFSVLLIPLLIDITSRFETFKRKEEKQNDKKWKATKFVEVIDNNRYLLSTILILGTIAAGYTAFQNRVNSNPRDYIPSYLEVRKATDYITERFGGITSPELVFYTKEKNGVMDPAFLNKVVKLEQWLLEQKDVAKVLSSLDFIRKSHQILNQDDPKFYSIPQNRKTMAEIFLLLSMQSSSMETFSDRVSAGYDKLRMTTFWDIPNSSDAIDMFNKIKAKAIDLDLDMKITGNSALGSRMNEYIVNTFIYSMGLALGLIFIVLCFLFKSLKLGLFSLFPNVLPILIGTAIMSIMNHNIEAGAVMVCCVCLGVAVDDTIHFMVNYIKNCRQGMSNFDAIEEVISHTGVALIVTTLILIVGFGVFMLADFIPNIRFGAYSATVLFLALIIDLVFLPALLLLKKSNK